MTTIFHLSIFQWLGCCLTCFICFCIARTVPRNWGWPS